MARKSSIKSLESKYRDLAKRAAAGDKDAKAEKAAVSKELFARAGRSGRTDIKALMRETGTKL